MADYELHPAIAAIMEDISAAAKRRCLDDFVAPAPDLLDAHGRAWLVNLQAARARSGAMRSATGMAWIVEAVWANCAWHSYAIVVMHLRPVEGLPTAVIHDAAATHEVQVWALDPAKPRAAMIAGAADLEPAMLTPCNFAAQFTAVSDAAAIERVEVSVRDILAGRLSPDSDFRQMWAGLFGSNMMKG